MPVVSLSRPQASISARRAGRRPRRGTQAAPADGVAFISATSEVIGRSVNPSRRVVMHVESTAVGPSSFIAPLTTAVCHSWSWPGSLRAGWYLGPAVLADELADEPDQARHVAAAAAAGPTLASGCGCRRWRRGAGEGVGGGRVGRSIAGR